MASQEPEFDAVRDELYGLLPDAFVAARTKAEKSARSAGDRDTAAAIKALGKPSVVAWLANQLVRQHRDEIEPLLELGAALREATRTLSGDELRTLSQQQNKVVLALVRQARGLARSAGQQVTEATAAGLEETLRAALADEGLAAELASGHLTSGLQYVGFGLMGGGAPARPAPVKRPVRKSEQPDPAAQQRAAELEAAEAAVLKARTAAEKAFDAERHARSAHDDAQAAARSALDQLEELRRRLDETQQHSDAAEEQAEQTATSYEETASALEQARAALTGAEERVQQLREQS